MTVISPIQEPSDIRRAIALQDWKRNRDLIINFICLWIAAVYILPVFDQIGLLIASLLFGQVMAIRFGGRDIASGSEVFAFSLTPRRSDYFWTRYVLGLSVSLVFLAIGMLGFYSNVSGYLWGLLVESGLTGIPPVQHANIPLSLAVVYLIGSFTCTYSMTVLGHRNFTNLAWAAGCIIWIGLPFLAFGLSALVRLHQLEVNTVSPTWMGLAGLATAAFSFGYAYWSYLRKSPTVAQGVGRGVGVFMIAAALLLLALFFVWSLAAAKHAGDAEREAREAAVRETEEHWQAEQRPIQR